MDDVQALSTGAPHELLHDIAATHGIPRRRCPSEKMPVAETALEDPAAGTQPRAHGLLRAESFLVKATALGQLLATATSPSGITSIKVAREHAVCAYRAAPQR
jgi:hypothetical protein